MTSPLPANLLNTLNAAASPVGAPEKSKESGAAFQALLDIGRDGNSDKAASRDNPAPKRQQDGRDAIANYVDAPADVKEAAALKNDESSYIEDIEVYVRKDTSGNQPAQDTKADNVSDAEPAQQSGAKGANKEQVNYVRTEPVVSDASASPEVVEAKDDNIASIVKLLASVQEVVGNILPQFNIVAGNTGNTGNTGNIEEALKALSPDVLQRMQSLLQNIQQVLQTGVPVAGKERAEIANVFGQMVQVLKSPVSDETKLQDVQKILDKLQVFSEMVTAKTVTPDVQGTEPVADAKTQAPVKLAQDQDSQHVSDEAPVPVADNDNKQTEVARKVTEQLITTNPAKQTDSQNSQTAQVQQNPVKADAANNASVAHQQAAFRTEGGAADSGFSDTRGGQKDNNAMMAFGVARANPQSAAMQTGGISFSKVLQQSAQQQPVLEQVMFHVKTAVDSGSSKIHIQLNPAELGKLDIKLEVDADGKTGITVTADNKSTLDLLQRDSRGLERALADAGLKADSGSLNFNLRGDGQDRGNDQSQAASSYRKPVLEEEPLALDLLTRSYVVNLSEGLDIKI